jgi:hypothetical protein
MFSGEAIKGSVLEIIISREIKLNYIIIKKYKIKNIKV